MCRWNPFLVAFLVCRIGVTAEAPAGEWQAPKLPEGRRVVTGKSEAFLTPPAALADVSVASEPPTVDLLFYPGQTYEGNPWSNWGDGVAVDGKYYSAIGDHRGPEGNAFVYEYDAASRELRLLVNLREVLDLPRGHYTPGKIHSRIDLGRDGCLYFGTHRGSTRVTTDEYHYHGDWILRHDPSSGRTGIVSRGPVGQQCIPCSVLDPNRLIFYGGTQAGDVNDKRHLFFAYDAAGKELLYSGYGGPGRYMMFSSSTGRVYFCPGLEGPLHRYDPDAGGAPVQLEVSVGLRAATRETPDGYIYAVSGKGDATIWRLHVGSERVETLAPAAVGSQTYITSIDADPTGRYLYYVPGAHGGSERDGSAVVQFDTKTRRKKVLAFLHPHLQEKYGYIPLGTFSTAVDSSGDKLYITWNGSRGTRRRGRLVWDACALTVIHIPESERTDPAARNADSAMFVEEGAERGLAASLRGIMAHAAASGDFDDDGDADLFVGGFCDRPPEAYDGADGPVANVLLVNESGRYSPSGQNILSLKARTSGSVFVDLDNDGDLDLVVTCNSKRRGLRVPNKLYENVDGRFRDVSEGKAPCVLMGGRSVGLLDFDGDGLLDLLIAEDRWTGARSRLFRNAGGLAFEDVTAAAGLPDSLPGLGVITPDLNEDGWPDIFVSDANRLFLSRGDGRYREGGSEAFQYERINREASPCGVSCGDLDRDGDLDIVIVDHSQPARQHLFLNEGLRGGVPRFRGATREAGLDYRFPSWTPEGLHLKHGHVEIADMDNNGWPDIVVAATYRKSGKRLPFVCWNRGGLRFDVPPARSADAHFSAGVAGDLDRDGRLDLFFASWYPHLRSPFYRNQGPPRRWLQVRVRGRTINRMGIGAKVRVYRAGTAGEARALLGYQEIGTGFGYCSGQEAVAHFGLGEAARCDLEVTLPFGRGVIRKPDVTTNRTILIEEP